MSNLIALRDRVVSNFRNFEALREDVDPAWLATLRREAIERFAEAGFPTRKREDWKYTPVDPIARALAETAARRSRIFASRRFAKAVDISTMSHFLVFVDGSFAPDLSSPGALPDGAVVDGLSNVVRDRPDLAEALLARTRSADPRCFVELNSAFQSDGAVVALSPGVVVSEPIHLLFLATEDSDGNACFERNLIDLADDASAVVVERHLGLGDAAYVTDVVTEATLGSNARLDHVALVRQSSRAMHLATASFEIGSRAQLRSHAISLGGALIRNDINALLAEEGAECVLNGIYVAGDGQHVDNQSTIDHAKPHGTSRELYKGILGGRSRGVFNGKVIVRPDAQKSDAQQYNPNLLLSDGAEIDTRPNLEIHADDVKCAHGSTVGCLDANALFFLRSRGIGERDARRMLARAFATEVVDMLPVDELRSELGGLVGSAVAQIGELR